MSPASIIISSATAGRACPAPVHRHLSRSKEKLDSLLLPDVKQQKKKKKKKRIGCQRDSIYSFSLTAGKDKWLKRDRNCLPINRVPVGLSPDAADHAEGRRQEEAGEATITPRQGLFGARSQTSLTYAPWVESAYVTKQHEVAAPRYLCVSRAARGPLPVRLVCSLAGSHVT